MSTQHFTDKQKCAFWIPPFGDIKEISKGEPQNSEKIVR